MSKADILIEKLGLQPLPDEGGMFVRTYESDTRIPRAVLGGDYDGDRLYSTLIYYLLRPGEYSALHRLRSDEVWHFYQGDPVSLFVIDPQGRLTEHTLGTDIEHGAVAHVPIRRGCWFGGRLKGQGSAGYALMGCTVAPGFEYVDFELGTRAALTEQFPQHRALIAELAR